MNTSFSIKWLSRWWTFQSIRRVFLPVTPQNPQHTDQSAEAAEVEMSNGEMITQSCMDDTTPGLLVKSPYIEIMVTIFTCVTNIIFAGIYQWLHCCFSCVPKSPSQFAPPARLYLFYIFLDAHFIPYFVFLSYSIRFVGKTRKKKRQFIQSTTKKTCFPLNKHHFEFVNIQQSQEAQLSTV